MADNVQVEQTNITVETNPAETVVEFRYYGVNEAILAALVPRVASLEDYQDQLAADLDAALAAGTGPLALQLAALEALVNGDIAALDAEEVARAAADVVLGNDIQALDDYLTPLVLAEPAARDAAIAVETAARIAAISAATAPIIANHDALAASVAAQTANISAIAATQVTVSADFVTLQAEFDALSAEFATWTTDFGTVESAVLAEATARANADVLRTERAANEVVTGAWTFNQNVTLGTDVGLVLDEHSSAPATPAAGNVVVYAKTDGRLYSKDDAGAETRVGSVERQTGATWGSATALIAANCADVITRIPVAGTITGVYVLTRGGPGSCVIDIRKDTFANFPPTAGDTITAAAKPTIASDVKYSDTTLTGWIKTLAIGDILSFHVESTSTFTGITVILTYE